MIQIPDKVYELITRLNKAGHEAYLVGGCVRDALLGKKPHDYDITTSALPEETKKVFRNLPVIETGIKHGTVTVVIDHSPFEITTYRIDQEYLDHRHPDSVVFTKSLKEDLSRRDFTINAMAYHPQEGLIDYFNGQKDLETCTIRCVGDAKTRFCEDALRILRALRFSSRYDSPIEEKTRKAMKECAPLLVDISAERIASELNGILCGKGIRRILTEYLDIFGVPIPELLPMEGFDQHNPHHIYDVLTHTAIAVESIPPEKDLRLAALFHDIGKPSCFSMTVDGIGHFYGHAKISEDLARNVLNRLKYDNLTKDSVLTLIKYHDLHMEESEKAVRKMLRKIGPELFRKLILLNRADNLAQNPDLWERQVYYDRLEEIADKVLAEEQCFSLKDLAINGSDLIRLGYSPGPLLGTILNDLLDRVVEGELVNDPDALANYAETKYAKELL
ncbi:MAG: HD domain-containing protein [Oscillospiraceae bacterium]|nr:HD domain-containing protein [Oscillospiraceae bacterium]